MVRRVSSSQQDTRKGFGIEKALFFFDGRKPLGSHVVSNPSQNLLFPVHFFESVTIGLEKLHLSSLLRVYILERGVGHWGPRVAVSLFSQQEK